MSELESVRAVPPGGEPAAEPPPEPAAAAPAAAPMGLVYQLALKACAVETIEELRFVALNDTAKLMPYERASLWRRRDGQPALEGVSGTPAEPDRALRQRWQRLAAAAGWADQATRMRPELGGDPDDWQALFGERSSLWLPFQPEGGEPLALWLERKPDQPWTPAELTMLGLLARAWAVAFRRFSPRRSLLGRRWLLACVLLLALVGLLVPRVRLTVLAEAEVVPIDPVLVTAPQEGVVLELLVRPGARVERGAPLFRYDPRLASEEHAVAVAEVQIARSRLELARTRALQGDEEAAAELVILARRLEQERARLRLAERKVAELEVRAPVAGRVQLDDPEGWRGRPVRLGERVLALADPGRTRVELRLAERDNLPGLEANPVVVYLDDNPQQARPAEVRYRALATAPGPDGVPRFRVEAAWQPTALPAPQLGQRGTAVLRGERVSPLFWLLRRPWAALRRQLGG